MKIAPERRSDGGYTLPEVLVALIFLGTVIAAIIGAMGASIVASDFHRKLVTADSVVRTYAERLQTAGYVACAKADGSNDAGYLPGNMFAGGQYAGFAGGTGMVSVQYWNGDSPATFSPTCGTDKGIQLITIKAASSDKRGSQTLDVIKRRPS